LIMRQVVRRGTDKTGDVLSHCENEVLFAIFGWAGRKLSPPGANLSIDGPPLPRSPYRLRSLRGRFEKLSRINAVLVMHLFVPGVMPTRRDGGDASGHRMVNAVQVILRGLSSSGSLDRYGAILLRF
jgi:hypothetical protein